MSDLTVGSATVGLGGEVTISVTTTADELGSYRVDVGYDSTLVTATECTSAEGECSIDAVASDTVRMNGSSGVNSLEWLLAATGLAVVAGGAWVLARARREN